MRLLYSKNGLFKVLKEILLFIVHLNYAKLVDILFANNTYLYQLCILTFKVFFTLLVPNSIAYIYFINHS